MLIVAGPTAIVAFAERGLFVRAELNLTHPARNFHE
jgi:hypothetical protein